jgi:uncharacterized protein DUF3159
MVPGAIGAVEEREDHGLTEPTVWGVLMTGLPGVLREGFLPLGAFYAGLELSGLTAGIVASALASVLIYLYERRRGRDALLVRLSLGFVAVQSIVGLIANSAIVYLAQPVLLAAAWGLLFVASVVVGRPLAGSLAGAWYPFPQWLKESADFKRVYTVESLVWGGYFLGRSALRLAVLLHGSIGGFLVITFLTGTPVTILLLVWSIRYAIRGLADIEPPAAA